MKFTLLAGVLFAAALTNGCSEQKSTAATYLTGHPAGASSDSGDSQAGGDSSNVDSGNSEPSDNTASTASNSSNTTTTSGNTTTSSSTDMSTNTGSTTTTMNTGNTTTTGDMSTTTTPAVNYASVKSIFDNNCSGCHGGQGNVYTDSYAKINASLAKIKSEVDGKKMPPGGGLGADDIKSLDAWFAKGAPEK